MTDNLDTVEPTPLALRVFLNTEGWMVTFVSSDVETPAATVVIKINPDEPNSFQEFMEVSSIFTADFMAASSAAMARMIQALSESHPHLADIVEQEAMEKFRLQGFSAEDAEALAASIHEEGIGG
jgi:hypothetical protein